MRYIVQLVLVGLVLSGNTASAIQWKSELNNKHEGKFYAYWGYNKSSYSFSNIHFIGNDYNFTLSNVKSNDRQTKFSWDAYFNPKTITIPQYNIRVGYFPCDNYEISIGIDHMKYVVEANQTVYINGDISGSGTVYDASYVNDPIVLSEDFLSFEHTDGLNFINASFKRFDDVLKYKFVTVSVSEGFELGALVPRTNTQLLYNVRKDEFHLAGYGISAVGAVTVTFGKHFFIQSEVKLGAMNLPDVRTTISAEDKASQNFTYFQYNILFGYTGTIKLKSDKKKDE